MYTYICIHIHIIASANLPDDTPYAGSCTLLSCRRYEDAPLSIRDIARLTCESTFAKQAAFSHAFYTHYS